MNEQISNLNIDYLRNGVYFDKLSTKDSSGVFSDEITNKYKKKYMEYSNSLNNLMNDKIYNKIINNLESKTKKHYKIILN
jgi:hypothetical protein